MQNLDENGDTNSTCDSETRKIAAQSTKKLTAGNKAKVVVAKESSNDGRARKAGNNFSRHLRRIKLAKAAADNLLKEADSTTPLNAQRASLELLWELVFDHLCTNDSLTISDFNTLSGVVQKLAASGVQLENALDKTSARVKSGGGGLSQETLDNIEKQLKLL